MRMMEKHKSIVVVGLLVILCTAAFLLGNIYAQRGTETAQAASSEQAQGAESGTLEGKNSQQEEQMAQIEVSRELAQYFLTEKPDKPLLQKNAKDEWGDSSLEIAINDVNAGTGAGKAIERVCKEAGIDPDTAKIRDLTEEQIIEIDQETYKNSDHPKN